jgi:hypothetical protein
MSDTQSTEPQPDPIEELIDFLTPAVTGILQRLDADEFTTIDFIDVLKTDPTANAAYEEAVRLWGEQDRYSRMVVHGQVIPLILRRSGLVDWVGYAHGQADDYAVPAWWRLRTDAG